MDTVCVYCGEWIDSWDGIPLDVAEKGDYSCRSCFDAMYGDDEDEDDELSVSARSEKR
jgi:hypothetical protein